MAYFSIFLFFYSVLNCMLFCGCFSLKYYRMLTKIYLYYICRYYMEYVLCTQIKKNITNITWTYFASDPDFTKSPKYVFHYYNRWYFVCYVHYDACKSHTCLINNSHLFKLMYVRYIFYYIRVIS